MKVLNENRDEYVLLCTGDKNGHKTDDGQYYFYTQMVLPMSTFAVAIGKWFISSIIDGYRDENHFKYQEFMCSKSHEPYPCHVSRGRKIRKIYPVQHKKCSTYNHPNRLGVVAGVG